MSGQAGAGQAQCSRSAVRWIPLLENVAGLAHAPDVVRQGGRRHADHGRQVGGIDRPELKDAAVDRVLVRLQLHRDHRGCEQRLDLLVGREQVEQQGGSRHLLPGYYQLVLSCA